MTQHSKVLKEYQPAFTNPDEPFLTYYGFAPDKSPIREHLSRGQFWSFARRAAYVIRSCGLGKHDCYAHYFSANCWEDLAFRLGAVMVGAVPVTINWQADTPELIAWKIRVTDSRMVVTDAGTPAESQAVLGQQFPELTFFPVSGFEPHPQLPEDEFARGADLGTDATRIIIFTSGTTSRPKGVRLSYRSYMANRNTFESFLQVGPEDRFAPVVVNPLHHTNSTAFTDWALRRPGTRLHLVERYSTQYWSLLREIADGDDHRIVAPTVSRHFDFLENLVRSGKLPVQVELFRSAMRKVDFLLGSAPVGPTTIARLKEYTLRVTIGRRRV